MPIIKTHDLKPGMILVKGVQNHSGRKLLPEGTLLNEKHIFSLKAWGITEADIKEKGIEFDSPPEKKIDPQKLARVEKEIGALFSHSNQDHPAVIEMMRLSSLNRLKKMPGMGHIDVK